MKIYFLGFFIFITLSGLGQVIDLKYYKIPVDIPVLLSGNFGELRSNHFHSGIDIKTQGKTGLPVFAAATGEVSRIKVSASGFGLALYIDHPNGQTTVYAHLLSLRKDMQDYVKTIQYNDESFAVDLTVPKGKISVVKGEQIALSGNSGSSGGPHLHFEIRDTENQHPINPLLFDFPIKDKINPKILSAMIYPLSADAHISGKTNKKLIKTVYYDGAYHLKGNPTITVYGDIGFGLQTIDYLDGCWSKCGVYEIKLAVDGELVYSFKMNELSFDETRYMNSHIDYKYYRQHYLRVHKSWLEPGNKFRNYPELKNRGIVDLSDGRLHHINYEILDVYGNKSTLKFRVQSKKLQIKKEEIAGKLIYYDRENEIDTLNLKAHFKEGTFYSNFKLEYAETPQNDSYYSPFYKLHNDQVAVHQSFPLEIRADDVPEYLQSKALLAVVNEKNGKKWSMGGSYEDGWIFAKVRQLGTFVVCVDTVAPTIKSLSIYNNSKLTEQNRIRFKISDDFSGISKYRGEIDGEWVLFEYDAKSKQLKYRFDETRFQFNKSHRLLLIISDHKSNETRYEATFYR